MCSICFLDFETTGLNPESDEIIEYAIRKYEDDTNTNRFVKPNFMEISEKITEITGITQDMVNENGITQKEACEDIERFLIHNNMKYVIAHNGHRFDYLFLKNLFNRNNKIIPDIKYVDSIHIFKSMIKLDSYSQKSLCERYEIVQENAHRAIGDVTDLRNLCYKAGVSIIHLDEHTKEIGEVKDLHGILHNIELFKNTDEKEYVILNLNSKERRLIHMYVDMFNKKNNMNYKHETNIKKTQLHIIKN